MLFLQNRSQIANELGFDVMCFSNCLQFYMEECLRREYVFSRIQHDLKFCLRILHKLKIVHKDVKPANIMFSYNHNRYVLADFGISHVIKERLGYKSKTYKQGSIGFMSLQMHQLKYGKQSYVDLYYNDLYGLKTSINEFECHYQIRELRQIKSKDNKQQLLEIFNIMEQNIYKSIYILKILLELRSKEVCLSQQQQKCYLQQEIKFMLQSIFKICLQQKQNLSTSSLMDIIQKNDYVDCLQNLIRCYGLTMELLYQLNKLNSTEQIEKIKNRIMDQKENNLISEQKIKKLKSMQAYNKYEFSLQCQLAYYRYLQKELNTSFKQKILKILLEIFFVNIQGNARFNYVDFLNLINEIKSHIKNCQIIEITQQILLFELLFQAILDKKSKQFNQIFQKCENLYPKSIQKFYKHIIKYYNVNMNNQNCIIIYGKQLELIYKQNQQIKVQYLWLLHSMAIAYQRINIKFTLYYFQQLKSKTLYYLTKIQQTNPQRIDCYSYLGIYYYSNQLYQQAITYYVKQVQMIKFVHGNYKLISAICYLNIANCFLGLTKMGEAEYYGKKAFQIIKFNSYKEYSKLQDECLCFMCMISLGLNKQQMVIAYYKQLVSRLNKKREKPIIQSSEFKIEQQYKSYSIQDFEQSMKEVDILLREGLQKEAQYIIDNQELQFQIKLQIYLRQKYYLDKIVDYSKKYNKQSGFLIQRQIKLKMNQYSFSQFIEQKLNLALLHFNTLQILKTVIEFHEMLPIKNIKLVNQIYKNICKKAQLINQLQSAKQYSLKRIQLIYGNQSQFDKHELIKCLIQLKKYFLKLKQYPEAIYYFKIFMKIHKHPQIYFVHDILSQLYMRFRTNHYNIKALNHTFKYYKMKKQLKNEKYTELKQLCKVLHKKDIIHLIDQYYMKVKATKQIHQSNANKIDQKNKQSEFFKSLKYWKKCIYLKKKFNLFQIIKIECIQQKIRKARLMLI